MKMIVNVDGGARGNPGPAAIGIVVRDGEGNVLQDLGETIGLDRFGASAPGDVVMRELGFTPEAVVAAAKRTLARL